MEEFILYTVIYLMIMGLILGIIKFVFKEDLNGDIIAGVMCWPATIPLFSMYYLVGFIVKLIESRNKC